MSETPARHYDPIALSNESTVVAEWVSEGASSSEYQSEAELERTFIKQLQEQAYEYFAIRSEAELVANLRAQLELLNGITFSDREWERFFGGVIAGKNDGIVQKTERIQEGDSVQLLIRDDGTSKNIKLIDKQNIHNNRLQVINQYEADRGEGGARYANRYDVTILVNGLPMVHVELKRRGVDIREAFNQIDRYQRDSFWAGSGLFQYVQLFVISNGTLTKYYSNTTRDLHLVEKRKESGSRAKKTSNSFEFTSWWADAQNRPIQDLTAFAATFFAKHTLLNILTKYCVLTADKTLLVMRPYQIVATERILQKIEISTNHKRLGRVEAGGYVWHTTGSGKTLTSFKTAQLATALPYVDKVLFVVDRKDLDYQTMREYDRFQKGAANSNTSTAVLKRQLEDPSARIIITTIQKLANFIAQNRQHPVLGQHVVIVFDECHRSQFGDMHAAITKAFKKYHLFGFTGTPIFSANAGSGGKFELKTTEQAFGERLHTYTVVDAITDKNVLPFRIDYVNTMRVGSVIDGEVPAIDTEQALLDSKRIRQVVGYTLEHFDQKTMRASSFEHSAVANVPAVVKSRRRVEEARIRRRVRGFNAIFATASIAAAKRYYTEFQRQMVLLTPDRRLKLALIYSYAPNEAVNDGAVSDGLLPEEEFETAGLADSSRDFLEDAIQDYNAIFTTSYDTSSEGFQNYYKDVSMRLKNRELDVVIVVNMFLTGFDATTLNTLFVDKSLKAHGLIQAYSRTNRILNSVKTYGNVVSFRDLEQETNDAIALFGNKDARGVVLLKPFDEYYEEYAARVGELLDNFPAGEQITGESAEKEFIRIFGSLLRLLNILRSFDDFAGKELLTPREQADYQSRYLDLHAIYSERGAVERERINEDVVFEIELVKQVEVNVDYILILVEKYRSERGDVDDKEIRAEISRAVDASPSLRNKKDLVEDFVDSVSTDGSIDAEWLAHVGARREAELTGIIDEERLRPVEARLFMDVAFANGELPTAGTGLTGIMPPTSRFSKQQNLGEKKRRLRKKLEVFFERFAGLGMGE